MPYPKTRTLVRASSCERDGRRRREPPGKPAAPPPRASASRSFHQQMERIAPRKISPETVVATFGRMRAVVSQLALR